MGWHSILVATREGEDALAYLTDERGLTLRTIRRFRLGWDSDREALTLPIFDRSGKIVNLRRRRLGPKQPWKGLFRLPCAFFPRLPRRSWLLLCEGEFDAMLAVQAGLPATTTTCGTALPDPLAEELAAFGRPVAIVYDVGAERAAEPSVTKLRAAGCEAWAVSLGLPDKGADISDWFLKYGSTRSELIDLIRDERKYR